MSEPTQTPALDLDAFLITADLLERGHDCHDDPKRAKWCASDPCRTLTTARQLRALVAEVRRLREREAKLRELHKPHGIYDECGHEHAEEDEILGIVDAGDAGLSCKKMYDVCTLCCDVADDGCQGETCVCDHDHGPNLPICKTREILDA